MNITIPAWQVTIGTELATENGTFIVSSLSQSGKSLIFTNAQREDLIVSTEDQMEVK